MYTYTHIGTGSGVVRGDEQPAVTPLLPLERELQCVQPRVPRHLVELDGKEEANGRRDFAGMLPHQVEEDQLLQVHVRDGGGGEFEVEQTDDFHHLGFE